MSYYDTLEDDLKRAKEILARGAANAEATVDKLVQDPEMRAKIIEVMGGAIYGADNYAAYQLLKSFVAEIERLHGNGFSLGQDWVSRVTADSTLYPKAEAYWRELCAADPGVIFGFTNREVRILFAEIDRLRGAEEPAVLGAGATPTLDHTEGRPSSTYPAIRDELLRIHAWITAPGNISRDDAIDEIGRVLLNRIAALAADAPPC